MNSRSAYGHDDSTIKIIGMLLLGRIAALARWGLFLQME